jgi:hypothetical protein
MVPKLSFAESYEAHQVGSQIVLLARRKRNNPTDIVYFESASAAPEEDEFSLLQDPSIVAVQTDTARSEVVAFKEFNSKDRVPYIRVRDTKGIQKIVVTFHPKGIEAGGTDFDVPFLPASATLGDAIAQMKSFDKRAVVVGYDLFAYQLFMNYQIAQGYLDRMTFAAMRNLGHPVSVHETRPVGRIRLFSMERPADKPLLRVTSLFESVGGSVAGAAKVCLCSSQNKAHTVFDTTPTLDQTPCPKAPKGHGTMNCF